MKTITKQYEASGWLKFYEEDIYEEGCIPKTGGMIDGREVFTGSTIEEVIKKCMDFVGVDSMDSCLLDSCEEDGRLDIQTLETDGSITANDSQIKQWKEGKLRLWASTYTFNIQQVTRKDVSLLQKVSK